MTERPLAKILKTAYDGYMQGNLDRKDDINFDAFLDQFGNPVAAVDTLVPGDGLGQFVMIELIESNDPDLLEADQVYAALNTLGVAISDLMRARAAINGLLP